MHATKKARLASICSAVLLVGVQLLSPFAILVPKVAAASNDKITICHATDSNTNPYVRETVNVDSTGGGKDKGVADHLAHTGPVWDPTLKSAGTAWGDIIPPVPGTDPVKSLNWTNQDGTANTDGQAIWTYNCNIPESGSVTVNKCFDAARNNQYKCDNTAANALGFQWAFDEQTPTWNSMGATVNNVPDGTQSITEQTAAGYTFTGWYPTGSQVYNCASPEGTTLPIDVSVTQGNNTSITLCNQADQTTQNATLTLIKTVVNDDGGTAGSDDFGLTIGEASVASGQTLTLPAGVYTVNEAGKTGYSFVSLAGTGCPIQLGGTVSLTAGQNVTCTITNDDDPGQLKVTKDVVNNYGGTAHASDFTMFVNGTPVAQNTYISEKVGTYYITERGPSGYQQASIACIDDGTQQAVGYPVNLALAQSVTCTVTNEDMPASLTVVKVAVPGTTQNFSFTSPELGAFSLTGDNTATSSHTFSNLSSGTYTFGEQSADNWQTAFMECRTKNYAISNNQVSVTLSNGDNVTCYVYNLELNTITGHKFNDVNDNHVWDNGEPTLKNWTIALTGCVNNDEDAPSVLCTNQVKRTTTTDANGAYSFTGLQPGTYTVCEVQQPNWTQTYPQDNNGCHEITIDVEQYGEVFTADFGNHPNPQVLGSSTTKLLVNTGMDASRNVIVGLVILSLLGSIHFLGARKRYNA